MTSSRSKKLLAERGFDSPSECGKVWRAGELAYASAASPQVDYTDLFPDTFRQTCAAGAPLCRRKDHRRLVFVSRRTCPCSLSHGYSPSSPASVIHFDRLLTNFLMQGRTINFLACGCTCSCRSFQQERTGRAAVFKAIRDLRFKGPCWHASWSSWATTLYPFRRAQRSSGRFGVQILTVPSLAQQIVLDCPFLAPCIVDYIASLLAKHSPSVAPPSRPKKALLGSDRVRFRRFDLSKLNAGKRPHIYAIIDLHYLLQHHFVGRLLLL